eukprot:1169017-Prymnesium_polylepis.1
MVDDGNDDAKSKSLPHSKMRAALEENIVEQLKVPAVLIVVQVSGGAGAVWCEGQGGPSTLKTIRLRLKQDCPVVLVKESGGCADMAARIVERLREQTGPPNEAFWEGVKKQLDLTPTALDVAKVAMEHVGVTDAKRHELVYIWSPDSHEGVTFDTVVLDAIVCFYRLREDKRRIQAERMKRHKQLLPLVPSGRPPHHNARGSHPAYPERAKVDDRFVPWDVDFPDGYTPTEFEHPALAKNCKEPPTGGRWADPVDVETLGPPEHLHEEVRTRLTVEGPLEFDYASHAPLNPRGRTGMWGRGLLGAWGANHAADPIVTRWDPKDRTKLQMVAIERKDTGEWAIPGGMVDPGESVSATVRREFEEEAGAFDEPAIQAEFRAMCDELFSNGEVVYQGYVDDPRNTDNAWMETTAIHFHCGAKLGDLLQLKAGDDAAKVVWLETNPEAEPRYAMLYASHRNWVDRVAESMHVHVKARSQEWRAYPKRSPVPDAKVSWRAPYAEYAPVDFTDVSVVASSRDTPGADTWADPTDVAYVDPRFGTKESRATSKLFATELAGRRTFEGP